jgi:hypothetical protein
LVSVGGPFGRLKVVRRGRSPPPGPYIVPAVILSIHCPFDPVHAYFQNNRPLSFGRAHARTTKPVACKGKNRFTHKKSASHNHAQAGDFGSSWIIAYLKIPCAGELGDRRQTGVHFPNQFGSDVGPVCRLFRYRAFIRVVQGYFRKGWFLRVLAGKYGVTQRCAGWGFRWLMDESLLREKPCGRARQPACVSSTYFTSLISPIRAYIATEPIREMYMLK